MHHHGGQNRLRLRLIFLVVYIWKRWVVLRSSVYISVRYQLEKLAAENLAISTNNTASFQYTHEA